jgi:Mce-associated membrane protein
VSEDKTTKILEDDLEDDTAVGAETVIEDDTEKTEETTTADDAGDVEDLEATGEPDADASDAIGEPEAASDTPKKRIQWSRLVAFVLLPALALALALGAGYLKWQDNSVRNSETAARTSVQAARDITIALLSYSPDKVEQQLGDARKLLTGEFRDSYTSLTDDVVIPGAKEKQISAVASVPAAASVSATATEAVVLVFVNQTVTVGQGAPTDTASSVRVTLDKVGGRWLISEFDPV